MKKRIIISIVLGVVISFLTLIPSYIISKPTGPCGTYGCDYKIGFPLKFIEILGDVGRPLFDTFDFVANVIIWIVVIFVVSFLLYKPKV